MSFAERPEGQSVHDLTAFPADFVWGVATAAYQVEGAVAEDGRCLVDIAFRATNQRGEDTMKGEATLALPSREHGPALLPSVPAELQRKAVEMMARHGELLREGRR